MNPLLLLLTGGYHQLMTPVNRKPLFINIRLHHTVAVPRKASLQGVGRIVKTSVQNTTVSPTTMAGDLIFFFDNGNAGLGIALFQLTSQGQPDNAGADDQIVGFDA